MMEVHNLLPAYNSWMTFRQRFLENLEAREMDLWEQLLHIRFQDRSMSAYLHALKSVVEELASIGRLLSSVELLSYALRVLPNTYEVLASTVKPSPIPLTFDQIRVKLLSHDQWLKWHDTSSNNAIVPAALVSSSNPQQTRGRGRSFNGAYYGHGGASPSSSNRSRGVHILLMVLLALSPATLYTFSYRHSY